MRPQHNHRTAHSLRKWQGRECTLPDAGTSNSARTATAHTAQLLLSPSGTLVNDDDDVLAVANGSIERNGHLAVAIRQRIESRLGSRVRDLSVRVSDKSVVLSGSCATYYTKQLAQHAALGVIEDEQLENEIVVSLPN